MKPRFLIQFASFATLGFASLSLSSNAATIVAVTGITGHDGGNWPDTLGHLTDMVNATNPSLITTSPAATSGMSNTSDPDPANWTWTSGSYQQTWHANSILDPTGTTNGKIGWVVMDFGSIVDNLENAYFWASSTGQTAGGAEQVRTFNLYYSSGSGINTLPTMPNSKATRGDYDFGVGDWAQIGSTKTLGSASGAVGLVESMGGVSARYVGIEVMTIGGVDDRMAIAQVEFTAVPEPSAALLGSMGLLALLRRRR